MEGVEKTMFRIKNCKKAGLGIRWILVILFLFQNLPVATAQEEDPDPPLEQTGIWYPDGVEFDFASCDQVFEDAELGHVFSSGTLYCGGFTPLHMAVMENTDKVSVLINSGADLEAKATIGGFTPLVFAAIVKNFDAAEALIEAGADVNATAAGGVSFLHALYVGPCCPDSEATRKSLAEAAINLGAEIDGTSYAGTTPLHLSVFTSKTAFEELISLGADVTAVDNAGIPVSSYAAVSEDVEFLDRVLALSGEPIVDKARDEFVEEVQQILSWRTPIDCDPHCLSPIAITAPPPDVEFVDDIQYHTWFRRAKGQWVNCQRTEKRVYNQKMRAARAELGISTSAAMAVYWAAIARAAKLPPKAAAIAVAAATAIKVAALAAATAKFLNAKISAQKVRDMRIASCESDYKGAVKIHDASHSGGAPEPPPNPPGEDE